MFSLLVAVLLLWLGARAVRAAWRAFLGPAPQPVASTTVPPAVEPPPWTPYLAPGAPMPSHGQFIAGYAVGHWMAEHHHNDDDDDVVPPGDAAHDDDQDYCIDEDGDGDDW
jgi:hypothetical protein